MYVEEGFYRKNEVLAAFLDVSGAFDNVDITILLNRLADVGLPYVVIKFIKFITYGRSIYTDITGTEARKVYKGVPQGGVLSPLLYSIYVSKITEKVPKSVISQFADDIAVYCSHKQNASSKKLIEKAINTIYTNLYNLGLTLCVS